MSQHEHSKTPKTKADERAVARFVDGEMEASERAAFEIRLGDDPALRAVVDGARAQSLSIRGAIHEASSASVAPEGFSGSVLDKVRRMPSRDELVKITQEEETVAVVAIFGQRLLIAAALIVGMSLLFSFNLLRDRDGNDLIADDGELMKKLDAQVLELRAKEAEAARKRLGIKKH